MDIATLRHNFELYDQDRSGYITIDELTKIYTKFGLNTSRDTLVYLLRKYDADGDGQINFSEFCDLMGTSHGRTTPSQTAQVRQPVNSMAGAGVYSGSKMGPQGYAGGPQGCMVNQSMPDQVSQGQPELPPGFPAQNTQQPDANPNFNPFEAMGDPLLNEKGDTPSDADNFTGNQFQKMQSSQSHINNQTEYAKNQSNSFVNQSQSNYQSSATSFGDSYHSIGSNQGIPQQPYAIPGQFQGQNMVYDSMYEQEEQISRPGPPGAPPHRNSPPTNQRQPPAHRQPGMTQPGMSLPPQNTAPLPGNSAYTPSNNDSPSPTTHDATGNISFSTYTPHQGPASPVEPRMAMPDNALAGAYATANTFESLLSDDARQCPK